MGYNGARTVNATQKILNSKLSNWLKPDQISDSHKKEPTERTFLKDFESNLQGHWGCCFCNLAGYSMLCEYNIRGALQLAIDSSIACRRADGPYIFRIRCLLFWSLKQSNYC